MNPHPVSFRHRLHSQLDSFDLKVNFLLYVYMKFDFYKYCLKPEAAAEETLANTGPVAAVPHVLTREKSERYSSCGFILFWFWRGRSGAAGLLTAPLLFWPLSLL